MESLQVDLEGGQHSLQRACAPVPLPGAGEIQPKRKDEEKEKEMTTEVPGTSCVIESEDPGGHPNLDDLLPAPSGNLAEKGILRCSTCSTSRTLPHHTGPQCTELAMMLKSLEPHSFTCKPSRRSMSMEMESEKDRQISGASTDNELKLVSLSSAQSKGKDTTSGDGGGYRRMRSLPTSSGEASSGLVYKHKERQKEKPCFRLDCTELVTQATSESAEPTLPLASLMHEWQVYVSRRPSRSLLESSIILQYEGLPELIEGEALYTLNLQELLSQCLVRDLMRVQTDLHEKEMGESLTQLDDKLKAVEKERQRLDAENRRLKMNRTGPELSLTQADEDENNTVWNKLKDGYLHGSPCDNPRQDEDISNSTSTHHNQVTAEDIQEAVQIANVKDDDLRQEIDLLLKHSSLRRMELPNQQLPRTLTPHNPQLVDIRSCCEQIHTLTDKLCQLRQEKDRQQETNALLSKALEDKIRCYNQLHDKLTSLKANGEEVSGLKAVMARMDSKIKELKDQRSHLSGLFDKEKAASSALMERIAQMESTIHELLVGELNQIGMEREEEPTETMNKVTEDSHVEQQTAVERIHQLELKLIKVHEDHATSIAQLTTYYENELLVASESEAKKDRTISKLRRRLQSMEQEVKEENERKAAQRTDCVRKYSPPQTNQGRLPPSPDSGHPTSEDVSKAQHREVSDLALKEENQQHSTNNSRSTVAD